MTSAPIPGERSADTGPPRAVARWLGSWKWRGQSLHWVFSDGSGTPCGLHGRDGKTGSVERSDPGDVCVRCRRLYHNAIWGKP